MDTIGKRIAVYRKKKNIKQDELAKILGVSPQAVSKWENDLSCPDISLLPALSDILGISIDGLVRGKNDESPKKALDDKTFIIAFEYDGIECSKMNLPMSMVRKAVEKGIDPLTTNDSKALKNVDFATAINMAVLLAENGVVGNVLECSENGVKVKFIVE